MQNRDYFNSFSNSQNLNRANTLPVNYRQQNVPPNSSPGNAQYMDNSSFQRSGLSLPGHYNQSASGKYLTEQRSSGSRSSLASPHQSFSSPQAPINNEYNYSRQGDRRSHSSVSSATFSATGLQPGVSPQFDNRAGYQYQPSSLEQNRQLQATTHHQLPNDSFRQYQLNEPMENANRNTAMHGHTPIRSSGSNMNLRDNQPDQRIAAASFDSRQDHYSPSISMSESRYQPGYATLPRDHAAFRPSNQNNSLNKSDSQYFSQVQTNNMTEKYLSLPAQSQNDNNQPIIRSDNNNRSLTRDNSWRQHSFVDGNNSQATQQYPVYSDHSPTSPPLHIVERRSNELEHSNLASPQLPSSSFNYSNSNQSKHFFMTIKKFTSTI